MPLSSDEQWREPGYDFGLHVLKESLEVPVKDLSAPETDPNGHHSFHVHFPWRGSPVVGPEPDCLCAVVERLPDRERTLYSLVGLDEPGITHDDEPRLAKDEEGWVSLPVLVPVAEVVQDGQGSYRADRTPIVEPPAMRVGVPVGGARPRRTRPG